MKVLEIVNNEAKFSINGEIYLPINDISKDDLLNMLKAVYTTDKIELDPYEDNEILNPADLIIYKNLYNEINGFLESKSTLKKEIDEEFETSIKKYESVE